MRLNEIINDPRSLAIDPNQYEKTWKNIEDRCSEAVQAYIQHGIGLWKGFNYQVNDDVIITTPAAVERKSRNTTNYYTVLLDNLPVWQQYPKRSRSLICANTKEHANQYSLPGVPYLILPFNGAKIGVCPESDIWTSFKHWQTLLALTSVLNNAHIAVNSYQAMISDILDNSVKLAETLYIPELAAAATNADVINIFSEILDPETNNFDLINISNLRRFKNSRRECWTSDNAYMIRQNSKFMKQHLPGPLN